MTVSTESATTSIYTGNGSTDTYAYNFLVSDEDNMVVLFRDTDGNQTTGTLNTDYTLTGVGNDAGGNIVLSSSLTLNYNLVGYLDLPYTQETDLANQQAYFLQSLEDICDNNTRLIQQLKDRQDLGVYKEATDSSDIPTYSEIAGYATSAAASATAAAASAAAAAASAASVTRVDWTAKNLVINVQGNTTVDAGADRISMLNSSNIPAYVDGMDITFDITTDLMSGTSEKASHWYQMWISVAASDGAITRLMVPDLASTADGNTANKLIDSAADFVTDKVSVGDILYNTTDQEKGFVGAIDDLNTISCVDADGNDLDLFPDGNEDYIIHMLSPTGLSAYKANIGMAYNNATSNLVNSGYTRPERQKIIPYSHAAGDFTVSSTNMSVVKAISIISQNMIFGNIPEWIMEISWVLLVGSLTTTTFDVEITGSTFESTSNNNTAITYHSSGVGSLAADQYAYAAAMANTNYIRLTASGNTNFGSTIQSFNGKTILTVKPTWAIRS